VQDEAWLIPVPQTRRDAVRDEARLIAGRQTRRDEARLIAGR